MGCLQVLRRDKLSEMEKRRLGLPQAELLRLNDWSEPAGWMLALFSDLAGLLLLLANPAPESELAGPVRPVLGLAWLILAFFAATGARSGLLLTAEGVEVRSRLRTKSLGWDEIGGFAFDQTPFGLGFGFSLMTGTSSLFPAFVRGLPRNSVERKGSPVS